MKAQDAIEKIQLKRTIFMNCEVQKYNYPVEIRGQLQIMAETGEISPYEYKKALDITWAQMWKSQKESELSKIN